jgi:hypothetical protein
VKQAPGTADVKVSGAWYHSLLAEISTDLPRRPHPIRWLAVVLSALARMLVGIWVDASLAGLVAPAARQRR